MKKAADTAAEIKRLEALRPQLEKELPVKQAALKTLQQKAGDVRRASLRMPRERKTAPRRRSSNAPTAWRRPVPKQKKIEEEIAKLKADKKDAAIPAVQKRLDNAKAEVADGKSGRSRRRRWPPPRPRLSS